MKKTNGKARKHQEAPDDEMKSEYAFDYRKAKPNRFAAKVKPGSRVIVLDADVAKVFTTPESVNSVLRAIVQTMPIGQTQS
ncbi:MAG TPA: hypothetical protein VGI40_17330 [Pirellulaceae bacterium]|jgi:hypothetical protein